MNEDDVTIEPENDADQAAPQKDLAEKVKKLKVELEEAKNQSKEYLDGWQRCKADVVNIKKREEEERKEFVKFAKSGIIEEMLQVLQSIDMATGNKESWEKVDKNWRSGVEYIFKQFRGVLESHGLEEIDPLGKIFDPNVSEAIEHVSVENKDDDHKVVEVIQKGYALNGKIIKPARVKVGDLKQ